MSITTFILVISLAVLMYTIDILSRYIFYYLKPSRTVIPHNARWFFIHAFTNTMISLASTQDLVYCIRNISTCGRKSWLLSSVITFWIATVSHLYHIAIFHHLLTTEEWFHHGVMLGIAAPLCLYCPTRASTVALGFLSGYPGMIDYSLLWCVKMGWLSRRTEKLYNVWINAWLRSPGCIFAAILTLPLIREELSVCHLIMALLTLWNGQYYMISAIRSHSRSLLC